MIELLRIRNFALFEEIELEFEKGLNVITGESGSGKSLILKAIDVLLGGKFLNIFYKSKKEKVKLEGIFKFDNEEFILKREIIPNTNRSRFYINDELVSLKKMREFREKAILYAAQDTQRLLANKQYLTLLFDSFWSLDLNSLKEKLLKELKLLTQQIRDLLEKIDMLKEQKRTWEFQREEIEKVKPKPKEEIELEKKKKNLRAQAEIQNYIQKAINILTSEENLQKALFELQKCVEKISQIDKDLNLFSEKIEEFYILLGELKDKLLKYPLVSDIEYELEKIEERLWRLSQLRRKFGMSIEDLITMSREKEKEFLVIEEYEFKIKELKEKQKKLLTKLQEVVNKINTNREKLGEELSSLLKKELIELGFGENIDIYFEFEKKPLFEDIVYESVPIFLWRQSSDRPYVSVSETASGGELSRIFLAFMFLCSFQDSTTLIFDEIESGIGGVILTKIGERIKKVSQNRQIIMISHWPYIASLADKNFVVEKKEKDGDLKSICFAITDQEKLIRELSRMAGGGKEGELFAKKLLTGKQ